MGVFHELGQAADSLNPTVKLFVGGGLGLASKILWDTLRDAWNERRRARQHDYLYLSRKQVELDQFTARICSSLDAPKVSLYRFHNGEHLEGGDSIKKMSMVSEAQAESHYTRWKDESQALLLSRFPKLIIGVNTSTYYWVYKDSCEDYDAQALMHARGYTATLAVLLVGGKRKPLGMLLLNWYEGVPDKETFNMELLDKLRRDLSFKLTE